MLRLKTYAITLSLVQELRNHQSWCGETHLQKSMFFLETLGGGDPIEFTFTLYKHGPYSFDFHEHLEELRVLGLLDLEYIPPYGPRYTVTKRGEWVVENQKSQTVSQECAIRTTVSCLGLKKVKELEKLGAALLVWRDARDASFEVRTKRLNAFKPHISLDEAVMATQEFDAILPRFQQTSRNA